MDPKQATDFLNRLADSPLCNPDLRAAPPTITDTHTDNHTARRTLEWPDGERTTLHLRHDDGDGKFVPFHWLLTDITPDTG
jgi:hypothetical protein